jgi:hypothetical protein
VSLGVLHSDGPLNRPDRYHLTRLKNTPGHPLVAELMGREPRSLARAHVATALLAMAPLAARLGWWWWTHGRHRTLVAYAPSESAPAAVEHTEIEMVKRTLGRWRVRVVTTRSVTPVAPALSAMPAERGRANWLRPVLQLTGAALEANSRAAPRAQPRLPAPADRPQP